MFSNASVVKTKKSHKNNAFDGSLKGTQRDAKRVNRKAAVASKREAGWL